MDTQIEDELMTSIIHPCPLAMALLVTHLFSRQNSQNYHRSGLTKTLLLVSIVPTSSVQGEAQQKKHLYRKELQGCWAAGSCVGAVCGCMTWFAKTL